MRTGGCAEIRLRKFQEISTKHLTITFVWNDRARRLSCCTSTNDETVSHPKCATGACRLRGRAEVVGEGASLPMRIRFDDLDAEHQPRSATAKFSCAWQESAAITLQSRADSTADAARPVNDGL